MDEPKEPSGWVKFNVMRHWSVIARKATPEDIANGTPLGKLHTAINRYLQDKDYRALREAISEYEAEQGVERDG